MKLYLDFVVVVVDIFSSPSNEVGDESLLGSSENVAFMNSIERIAVMAVVTIL